MDITNFFTVETSELSKSDRKIMKRMTSDLTNVESLTINHLAEEAGTSLASVQRFCQKMGYSGFKEFKSASLIKLLLLPGPPAELKPDGPCPGRQDR